ncbi:MAG: DUF481 domain-containing protein [Pirellulales bacterium]|nr:DUF481 domain-containing protein [Pirellulales bacterium]
MLRRTLLLRVVLLGLGCVGGSPAPAQSTGPAVLPPPEAGGIADAIPLPAYESLLSSPQASPAETPLTDLVAEPVTPTPYWYQPAYWFGPVPWDAGVELGINGSQGNNETFSMRSGGHLKRETPNWKFDSSLAYNKNHANGVETQNNGKLDVRLDRILAASPWSVFYLGNLIYDEFQTWDTQLSLNTGVGRQIFKTPDLDLTARFGAGAVREFGGVNNDWAPQALFGADYSHQISPSQKLVGKVDYYPEWADFNNYRVVTDLGWQVALDKPKNVSLKVSVIDWYDSTPDGASPNTLNYAVLLIWAL